jgi:hypothetical protein
MDPQKQGADGAETAGPSSNTSKNLNFEAPSTHAAPTSLTC